MRKLKLIIASVLAILVAIVAGATGLALFLELRGKKTFFRYPCALRESIQILCGVTGIPGIEPRNDRLWIRARSS
jgi:hypothetical protein